jgi:F-type H+-transporting ATPase subunit delta
VNAAAEARLSELDRALDACELSPALADELFSVADLLSGQAGLRNALADPTMPDDRRRELARGLLAGRVSAGAGNVVAEAAGLKWSSAAALVAAIERQAVRALLGHAQAAGVLDTVEEELFRFSRTVAREPQLRGALDEAAAGVQPRRQLVSDLLATKSRPETLALARRAVGTTSKTFEHAIDAQLKLAAALRRRAIAVVTVARPPTDGQRDRLRTALVGQLGREINLQVVVDPAVLGGARVQVGDEVIEGTVAGRLAAAESQLA